MSSSPIAGRFPPNETAIMAMPPEDWEVNNDLVIVSRHEKGFWQADFYKDGKSIPAADWEVIGPAPDSFFTMKRGRSLIDTMHKAQAKWPGARINYVGTVSRPDQTST